MSKSKLDATSRTTARTDKSKTSAQHSPSFFNPTVSSTAKKRSRSATMQTPEEQVSTTDILLAGILEELKTRNQIELMKLHMAVEKEQAETEAAEELAEKEKAHFENEIRSRMYM